MFMWGARRLPIGAQMARVLGLPRLGGSQACGTRLHHEDVRAAHGRALERLPHRREVGQGRAEPAG